MPRGIASLTPVLIMLFFLMVVQILALSLIQAIPPTSKEISPSPASLEFPIVYMIIVLIFTAIILLAIKLKQGWAIRSFVWIAMAISLYYVLLTFLSLSSLIALVPTFGLLLLVHLFPEWYVIDIFCILICAGISSIFGVNIYIYPTLFLLVIMAVYDAISVYKTGHMILLAKSIIKLKAPLVFVLPKSKKYSSRWDQVSAYSQEKRRSPAYILGLGDAIIPTILVVSANYWLTAPSFLGIKLPALGAMIGTYLGFLILMTVLSDRYHAGLPLLNSGAIFGFFAGCFFSGIRLLS